MKQGWTWGEKYQTQRRNNKTTTYAGVVAVVVGVELVVVVVAGVDGDGTGAPLVDDPAGVEALPEELKQVVAIRWTCQTIVSGCK
jgi:hypothetical protein